MARNEGRAKLLEQMGDQERKQAYNFLASLRVRYPPMSFRSKLAIYCHCLQRRNWAEGNPLVRESLSLLKKNSLALHATLFKHPDLFCDVRLSPS